MTILHIDSSINGEKSVSRVVSRSIVDQLTRRNPDANVIYRDLALEPLPHFTLEAYGDSTVVDEFLAADTIVIGAPMYNFGIPSQLKSWTDRLAIPGKTFRYTQNGPEGLAGDKKVIIASSRGGFFGAGTPSAVFDHQETYLRAIFGFLGIPDLTFVNAEGVAVGTDGRDKAIASARAQVLTLAAA